MDDKTLKRLQEIEAEILVVVDEFCKKHNVKYSLYAGTALGAVRHGGFIPWDDDIDVCMERTEYERFLNLWQSEGVDGYTIQATNNPYYEGISHTKIIKEGIILASKEENESSSNYGIWLDIFPLDKVPQDKKARKKFFFRAKLRMIYTRGYPYKKGGKFLEIVSKILLLRSRKSRLKARNKLEKKLLKYQSLQEGYDLMSLSCPEGLRIVYPGNMMDEITKIKFGELEVSISTRWHEMLEANFGDYMTLPPEEQRVCKHESEIIELGK